MYAAYSGGGHNLERVMWCIGGGRHFWAIKRLRYFNRAVSLIEQLRTLMVSSNDDVSLHCKIGPKIQSQSFLHDTQPWLQTAAHCMFKGGIVLFIITFCRIATIFAIAIDG